MTNHKGGPRDYIFNDVDLFCHFDQMITKLGLRSKCFGLDLDLRSKETKQLEIQQQHDVELKRVSLEERKLALREKELSSQYAAFVDSRELN